MTLPQESWVCYVHSFYRTVPLAINSLRTDPTSSLLPNHCFRLRHCHCLSVALQVPYRELYHYFQLTQTIALLSHCGQTTNTNNGREGSMLAHLSGDFRILLLFLTLTHNPRYVPILTPLILLIIYLLFHWTQGLISAHQHPATGLDAQPSACGFLLRQVYLLSSPADLELTRQLTEGLNPGSSCLRLPCC